MICRYCGHRIKWTEQTGWTREDEIRVPHWAPWDCLDRPESDGGPTAGHRLPRDPRDPDSD